MNLRGKKVALLPLRFKIVKKQMRLLNPPIKFFELEEKKNLFLTDFFDSVSITFQNIM